MKRNSNILVTFRQKHFHSDVREWRMKSGHALNDKMIFKKRNKPAHLSKDNIADASVFDAAVPVE